MGCRVGRDGAESKVGAIPLILCHAPPSKWAALVHPFVIIINLFISEKILIFFFNLDLYSHCERHPIHSLEMGLEAEQGNRSFQGTLVSSVVSMGIV